MTTPNPMISVSWIGQALLCDDGLGLSVQRHSLTFCKRNSLILKDEASGILELPFTAGGSGVVQRRIIPQIGVVAQQRISNWSSRASPCCFTPPKPPPTISTRCLFAILVMIIAKNVR